MWKGVFIKKLCLALIFFFIKGKSLGSFWPSPTTKNNLKKIYLIWCLLQKFSIYLSVSALLKAYLVWGLSLSFSFIGLWTNPTSSAVLKKINLSIIVFFEISNKDLVFSKWLLIR